MGTVRKAGGSLTISLEQIPLGYKGSDLQGEIQMRISASFIDQAEMKL